VAGDKALHWQNALCFWQKVKALPMRRYESWQILTAPGKVDNSLTEEPTNITLPDIP